MRQGGWVGRQAGTHEIARKAAGKQAGPQAGRTDPQADVGLCMYACPQAGRWGPPYLPSGEKRTVKTSDELSVMVMDGVMRCVGCDPGGTQAACPYA